MAEKFEVHFTSLSDPNALYSYSNLEVPRIGDHVIIFDTPASGKIVLEGKVVKVRWVIIDSEKTSSVMVIIDGIPI